MVGSRWEELDAPVMPATPTARHTGLSPDRASGPVFTTSPRGAHAISLVSVGKSAYMHTHQNSILCMVEL
jgi:hypothetical protein